MLIYWVGLVAYEIDPSVVGVDRLNVACDPEAIAITNKSIIFGWYVQTAG